MHRGNLESRWSATDLGLTETSESIERDYLSVLLTIHIDLHRDERLQSNLSSNKSLKLSDLATTEPKKRARYASSGLSEPG